MVVEEWKASNEVQSSKDLNSVVSNILDDFSDYEVTDVEENLRTENQRKHSMIHHLIEIIQSMSLQIESSRISPPERRMLKRRRE